VHRLLDQVEQLDDPALIQALHDIPPLLHRDEGLLAATWPQSPDAVMTAVNRLAPQVAAAVDRLAARYDQLVREEGEMARALESLHGRIARLEQGESDLQPATRRLIALLADHGIAAVPLCDRVDLADEAWRDALEAFLGGHREALLVEPGQVREAIGLYRREGKQLAIHGSRVINTLKSAQWRGQASPGSLAEVAISDDPHARAYLIQRTGNIQRVETEDELLRQERAITADGMLASGGAVVRLAPVEPMLGREARRLRLQALKAQFDGTRGLITANRPRSWPSRTCASGN
jgi:chromosome segregation ATPase